MSHNLGSWPYNMTWIRIIAFIFLELLIKSYKKSFFINYLNKQYTASEDEHYFSIITMKLNEYQSASGIFFFKTLFKLTTKSHESSALQSVTENMFRWYDVMIIWFLTVFIFDIFSWRNLINIRSKDWQVFVVHRGMQCRNLSENTTARYRMCLLRER